jgi:hypothetical protein
MAGIGRPPKPASKRRRRNVPTTYGAAEPIVVPAADGQMPKIASKDRELGIDNPHQLVVRMWATVQESCEARFYSEADWARLRLELWNANQLLTSGKPITGNAWATVQHGLNAMLISPAEKRRAAIEVKPIGTDPDEDAGVSMTAKYQRKLHSVNPE